MILEQLKQIAHGMALQFGNNCEIVIHDVSQLGTENTVVHIENGEISNRKVGDGPTHPVLEASLDKTKHVEDRYGYLTKTKDGRVFKSTTMFIRDEKGEVKYLFCINMDISDLKNLEKHLSVFIYGEDDKADVEAEEITKNVSELLDDLLRQCERRIGKQALRMTKAERIEAIQFLNEAGVFLISKSMDYVADYFGISKYTVYNYINSSDEGKEDAATASK